MTVEEYSNKLKACSEQLQEFADKATLVGLDEFETQFLERVYNLNQDINGVSFGGYRSEAYKDYRLSLNLQVSHKDLQLSDRLRTTQIKDTEKFELRLSTASDKTAKARAGKFRNTDITQVQKARYQEQQLGKRIYEPSEKERELSLKAIDITFINQVLDAV